MCQLIAVCAWAAIRLLLFFFLWTFVTAIASLGFSRCARNVCKTIVALRLIADASLQDSG